MPGYWPEDLTTGYLPEDAQTMAYITFEAEYPLYSESSTSFKAKALHRLLCRFMPENSIEVRNETDHKAGTVHCMTSCWLSKSELSLISKITGYVSSDEDGEMVLTEKIDLLEAIVYGDD